MVVGVGAAAYATLVITIPSRDEVPIGWSLSHTIRTILITLSSRLKSPFVHSTEETIPRRQPAPYILTPLRPPRKAKSLLSVTGSETTILTFYNPSDVGILVDMLCNSPQPEESERAMEELVVGEWESGAASQYPVKHRSSIFHRYNSLAATCRDVERIAFYDEMVDRVRRLLRFVQWFDYQLTVEQRHQVEAWPSSDLADRLLDETHEEPYLRAGDVVLSESVRSKLHHVRPPRGAACSFCLNPPPGMIKYVLFIEGGEPWDDKSPPSYFETLLSACI